MTEKDRKEIMTTCDIVLMCNGASVSDRRFYNNVLRLIYDNMDLEKENKRLTELLKGQEAVEPEWFDGTPFCGNCGHRLEKKSRNNNEIKCPTCRRAVKWE